MGRLLRLLGFYICVPIYKIIPKLYEIFYALATGRFFEDAQGNTTVLEELSSNLYILISVVMLFAFSATLISAIVNPDLLEDKKKGIASIFKRSIIGLIMIVVVPVGFDYAYKIQFRIIDNHIIEKILVGMNVDSTTEGFTGGNGGKVIAGSLISSVLYPDLEDYEGNVNKSEVSISALTGSDPQNAYNSMVKNINTMGNFDKYLNSAPENGEKDYAFEFNGIIAIIAGLATDYILLIFAMDMAVRLFKLAFFELTAPVSIVAYIAAGGDIFKKWLKEVGITFADVFIRIAAMAFYLFMISNLDDFLNSRVYNGGGVSWKLLLKVLLIIGMLIFIKQLPDLVKKVFGFDMSSKGGIKGRLGEMAAGGKQAQAAWDKMRQVGKLGAGALVGASAVTGAAFMAHGAVLSYGGLALGSRLAWKKGIRNIDIKGKKIGDRVDDRVSELKSDAKTIGKFAKEKYKKVSPYAKAYMGADGVLKGGIAAIKQRKETETGKARTYEKELQAAQELRQKMLKELHQLTQAVPALKFADDDDGNKVLNVKSMSVSDCQTSNFAAAVNRIDGFSEFQKKHMQDYNKKENALMVAQNNETYSKEIKKRLERSLENETTDEGKKQIRGLISALENGKIADAGAFATTLNDAISTTYAKTQKDSILKEDRDSLNALASAMTDFSSVDKLSIKVANAQDAFNRASQKVDDDIEHAPSDKNKAMLKEFKKNSKAMNEKNTGRV